MGDISPGEMMVVNNNDRKVECWEEDRKSVNIGNIDSCEVFTSKREDLIKVSSTSVQASSCHSYQAIWSEEVWLCSD